MLYFWEVLNDFKKMRKNLEIRELRYGKQIYTWIQLWERLKDGKIIFEPIYNKEFGKDWSISKKSKFIESIFLGLPMPPFYFDGTDWDRWLVVDGRKRLKTFYEFRNNEFALKDLDFLDLNGKKYEDIGFRHTSRFGDPDILIDCYIVSPQTYLEYRVNFFKRFSSYSIKNIKTIIISKTNDKEA